MKAFVQLSSLEKIGDASYRLSPCWQRRGDRRKFQSDSDGAAAILVANREVAEAEGLKPRAKFRARVVVGSDPKLQLTGVIPATQLALKKAGLALSDIDWIEINEAFATVVLAWERELKPDMAKVNPWGGAIAHGHPVGATGSILMAEMLSGLDSSNGQFGLQVMCAGHSMATCTIIERL